MYIDSSVVIEAMLFYKEKGYTPTSVPLIVDEEVSDRTKPVGRKNLHHNVDKVYVASAEQSFIQMFEEGRLNRGKWMAITPCVRDEQEYDETHYKTFLKIELINVGSENVSEVMGDGVSFFTKYSDNISITEDNSVFDLNINNIEVGSYGSRFFEDGTPYVFGTGLAEPRFSVALSKTPRWTQDMIDEIYKQAEILQSKIKPCKIAD